MSDTQPQTATLNGSIERVTFYNEENGYCVLRVKAKGQRELVTLVGHSAAVTAGETIEATGEWSHHREFGLQFTAGQIRSVAPTTLEGIEKFLGSGMVKGVGPHFAAKLVHAFGHEVFSVIENRPEELRRVPGLGRGRIAKITAAWAEQKSVRDIMVFLQSHGVSTGKAVRIFRIYGAQAVARVTEDPYRLARDIAGIGFKSADKIALQLGVPRDAPARARAGIAYALLEKTGEGHCAYPQEELIAYAAQLLELPPEALQIALEAEVKEGRAIREPINGRDCIFPVHLHACETAIANRLREMMASPVTWADIDPAKALAWVESRLSLELAPLQRDAVAQALRAKVLVITGGPGTGKTTLTRALVTILLAKGIRIGLCSPTGRAAKRLAECTQREAKTVHRLLGYDPKKGGFLHDRQNPLALDLVLVDEASMLDTVLMHHLLKALPERAALILVGDVDQIPSVGPGVVLQAMIQSGAIPTVRLTQIFRQAASSRIVANAHRINRGEMPEIDNKDRDSDFYFFAAEDPETAARTVVDLVRERIPKRFGLDPREIQVLTPMNRSGLGARTLSQHLQQALNPNGQPRIERFGTTYACGDKVMVTANDYDKEVFNGDVGFISRVDTEDEVTTVEIDGRPVDFTFSELDSLSLAYAVTIHKAQGSEYPAVVIPVSTQHFLMLRRNLLYTAVTRGKRLVVLVGQSKAIALAVGATEQGKRWSGLAGRLKLQESG